MISTGEMAVGQIITVYSTNAIKQIVMTMEGEKEIMVPAETNMLTGVPLEIVSVDLPFIMCKFLVFIPRLPQQQVILDTRSFIFKEVKPAFAKTYRKLYGQKKQINTNPNVVLPRGGSILDFIGLGGNREEGAFEDFDKPKTLEDKKDIPPSGQQPELFG